MADFGRGSSQPHLAIFMGEMACERSCMNARAVAIVFADDDHGRPPVTSAGGKISRGAFGMRRWLPDGGFEGDGRRAKGIV